MIKIIELDPVTMPEDKKLSKVIDKIDKLDKEGIEKNK